MKKRILIGVFFIAALFTITACGGSSTKDENGVERESKKNQEGFVEGKYSINNLTYNINDSFENQGNNRFALNDGTNGIMIELFVNSSFAGTLDEYIAKDENHFYPNTKSLEEAIINGNPWLKGKTTDNGIIYYIKDGSSIYSIMISPLYTSKSFFDDLVTTFENSLYFK